MGEDMPHHGQRRTRLGRLAKPLRAPVGGRQIGRAFRQAPHAAPDAPRRPTLQPDMVIGCLQDQQGERDFRYRARNRARRIGLGSPEGSGAAIAIERTRPATGLSRRATGRAQIHHGLGIVTDPLGGRQRFGHRPQPAFAGGPRRVVERQESAQYPLYIAIQDGVTASARQSRNGPRRGAPDTGQRAQTVDISGKAAVAMADHPLRGAVQIAATGVVAQPCP